MEQALDDCDAALRLYPQYTRALFRRGVYLLEAGQAEESVKAFENLLRVDRAWPQVDELALPDTGLALAAYPSERAKSALG